MQVILCVYRTVCNVCRAGVAGPRPVHAGVELKVHISTYVGFNPIGRMPGLADDVFMCMGQQLGPDPCWCAHGLR